MVTEINSLSGLGWRRITFSFVVLAYLGFLVLINMLMFLPDNAISAMGHFSFIDTGDTHNLIHELIFAFIVGTAAGGLFFQLWKPLKNVAGQMIALITWGVLILTAALTNNWVPQPLFIIFGGLTILATILHPARDKLFNWFRFARINKLLFLLIVIAAVPLMMYAFTNINLQIAGGGGTGFFHNPPSFHSDLPNQEPVNDFGDMATDNEADHDEQEHAAQGHYRNMAAFSFIIILVGLLASLQSNGWRFMAWVVSVLTILFGFLSVMLPDAESSLGIVWGLVVIVWGVAFIVTTELTKKEGNKYGKGN